MTIDRLDRPLRDLRISVTDRCNFRCVYCMPKEVFGSDYRFLDRKELLTFEEIARVASVFVGLGVEKLRLTGGEPLVRKDVEKLIALLAPLGAELTLTTNASLLAAKAHALAAAGLHRITVSLDSLDDATFRMMNDVDFSVSRVLEGIAAAADAGLPVKVNAVVKRGLNDDGGVEIGVIASVTQPFCGDCTRARISAEGRLYTCLFGVRGHDLRARVRAGVSDEELQEALGAIWGKRTDRYSEQRSEATLKLPKVEMSYIGGLHAGRPRGGGGAVGGGGGNCWSPV